MELEVLFGESEYESVEAATKAIIKVVDTVEPETLLTLKYEGKYQKFRKIFPTCEQLFKELI